MSGSPPTPLPRKTIGPDDSTLTGSEGSSEGRVPADHVPGGSHFLREVRAFEDLPAEVLEAVSSRLTRREFAPGSLLVEQGAPAEAMYLLTEGNAAVRLERGWAEESVELSRLETRSIVGEISLLTREPCTASVEALTPVVAYALSAEDFHELSQRYPMMAVAVAHLISSRLGGEKIDALCGKSVHGYLVESRLGRGGMAVVYKATREATGETVALKMMDPELIYDRTANQRFHREAAVGMQLRHPGIVQVHEQFSAYGTQFFVMDYCGGGSVAECLRRGRRFELAESRRILKDAAGALAFAHGEGVVHRDLKPANLLFDGEDNVRLADFGLARAEFELSLTKTGQVLGTPRYMPPEQLSGGDADVRADIYALGCIAFELLTGRCPFVAMDLPGLFREKLTWTLPPAREIHEDLPPELYEFLRGALEPIVEQRVADLRLLA